MYSQEHEHSIVLCMKHHYEMNIQSGTKKLIEWNGLGQKNSSEPGMEKIIVNVMHNHLNIQNAILYRELLQEV